MTIDERLDRLTERHEALTQSVELLVHSQHDALQENREAQRENREAQRKNEALMAHILESIDGLARIAHAHEQRISGLETGHR
jgi:hypothetical protein